MIKTLLVAAMLSAASILPAVGQTSPLTPGQKAPETPRPAQIQWFPTWEQARVEAARTGRPILLTAAAPHCRGIPGMW